MVMFWGLKIFWDVSRGDSCMFLVEDSKILSYSVNVFCRRVV